MSTLFRELRQAARTLARNPGFTTTAVLVLALAVGGNAAMFGIVDPLLLRPLPAAHDGGELVGVYSRDRTLPDTYRSFSYPNYADLRARADIFTALMAQTFAQVALKEDAGTRRTLAAVVSSNYFDTLGATIRLGRGFSADEERPGAATAVAIVSQAYLRRRGIEAAAIIGGTVFINNQPFTVVGAAPRGFTGTTSVITPEVWLPIGAYDSLAAPEPGAQRAGVGERSAHRFVLAGRLHPGVTIPQIQPLLAAAAQRFEEAYPADNKNQTLFANPLPRLAVSPRPQNNSQFIAVAILLLAMSTIVLVVACLNLANMLLARGAARAKEVAVRLALGGKRMHIVNQLLTEGLLLSLAGGALGLVLAFWSTALIMSSVVSYVPMGIEFNPRPDARMLVVTLAFCVISALSFSLGPAWRLSGANLAVDLRTRGDQTGPTRRRRVSVPQLLVVAQLAISLGLLTAAGLFTRTAANAGASDPGFSTEQHVLATVDAGMRGHDEARGRALYATLLDRFRRLPGAEAATLASIVPFGDTSDERFVEMTGRAAGAAAHAPVNAIFTIVGAGYFSTLGLSVSGREFSAGEELSAAGLPVAVIDEPLARRLFARDSPLDQTVCLRQRLDRPCDTVHIVGVVPGVRHDVLDPDPVPHVYVPFGQRYQSTMTFHLRTSEPGRQGEAAMVRRLRTEIEAVDPALPVLSIRTMREHRDANIGLWLTGTAAILFATFGALALLLATVGTYGLRAHLVALRTREIGVRMALGATSREIQSLFIREGLKLTAAGLGLGLLFAFAVGALSRSFLYQVNPFDPLVVVGASGVLLLTSIAASYLPARRAASVSPALAMGTE